MVAPRKTVVWVLDWKSFHILQEPQQVLLLGQEIRRRREHVNRPNSQIIKNDGLPTLRFRLFIHMTNCTTSFAAAKSLNVWGFAPGPRILEASLGCSIPWIDPDRNQR
jgi:hypothetical protein